MSHAEDIVARLRAWAHGAQEQDVTEVAEGLRLAADDIKRLRDELVRNADEFRETLTDLRGEMDTLTTELEMWRDGNIMAESHRDEVEKLTAERDATIRELRKVEAERDEARREVCRRAIDGPEGQRHFAFVCGWDCFKEHGK